MSRRLALRATVSLVTLVAASPASAAPATTQGITLGHEGFEIGSCAVVVLIGANDDGARAAPMRSRVLEVDGRWLE